jgi:CRP/FNR family transcriptional regulator, cyclic AMP receptor protein
MSTSTLSRPMQPENLKLFPLFNEANPETLEKLLSVSTEHDYPVGRTVLMEDSWGNAVYFIVSGWVKVRREAGDDYITLAVLGKGDFFGEMAILEESPRSTDVVALSPVKLLSVPAQPFIDTLFKDSLLHHRMLRLMVQRLRQSNIRFQLRHKPPAVKLVHVLTWLADAYGNKQGDSIEMLNLSPEDISAVADISKDDVVKIKEKLEEKGWIKTNTATNTLSLPGFKHLLQLAQKA